MTFLLAIPSQPPLPAPPDIDTDISTFSFCHVPGSSDGPPDDPSLHILWRVGSFLQRLFRGVRRIFLDCSASCVEWSSFEYLFMRAWATDLVSISFWFLCTHIGSLGLLLDEHVL